MSNLYLAHHGIKGQRWGVRRYQNEDGSLTNAGEKKLNIIKENDSSKNNLKKGMTKTQKILLGIGAVAVAGGVAYSLRKHIKYGRDYVLKSGKKIQRISKDGLVKDASITDDMFKKENKLHDMFYVSENKKDNDRYRKLMPQHYAEGWMGTNKSYLKEMELEKDIKVAGDSTAKKIYKSMKKEGLVTDFGSYQKFNKNLVSDDVDAKAFFKKLSEKGYNSIGDLNDRNKGFKTKNPLIFFGDAKDKVKINKVSLIDYSNEEIKKLANKGLLEAAGQIVGEFAIKSSLIGGSAVYGKAWVNSFKNKEASQ